MTLVQLELKMAAVFKRKVFIGCIIGRHYNAKKLETLDGAFMKSVQCSK